MYYFETASWFKIETYFSFNSLSNYIEEVLGTYGKNSKYVINFVSLLII